MKKKSSASEQSMEDRFNSLVANMSEHYADYLVIARIPDGMLWRASDKSWALGACERYVEGVKQTDVVESNLRPEDG